MKARKKRPLLDGSSDRQGRILLQFEANVKEIGALCCGFEVELSLPECTHCHPWPGALLVNPALVETYFCHRIP